MRPRDAITIAVATSTNNRQLMIHELGAGRISQRSSVQSVHPIGLEITWEVRRAPNSADIEDHVRRNTEFGTGALQAIQDPEVTATRAPVGVDLALVVLRFELEFLCRAHGSVVLMILSF